MLTIAKIKNINYYKDLATEDYYLKGGEPSGIWAGVGASLLNLKGKVDDTAFANIMAGYSPDKKQSLCQKPGKSHQPGLDLTFNAPKSVSLLWAIVDDELKKKYK
jgi:conjugative relaxase-like TrwC/TraI family protein